MPQHDKLKPQVMGEAIKEVGAKNCIMATDFGQKHNPRPVVGMEMMIENMMQQGISPKEIGVMCHDNPEKLLF
jgi:predicted metal-dependent phosphotriesterase family hydrolase